MKYFYLLFIVTFLFSTIPAQNQTLMANPTVTDSGFAGGSGSDSDPYQVSSKEHLDLVRLHLDKHFRQTADIDLGGENWLPIGYITGQEEVPEDFTGSFDGYGFVIENLTIDREDQDFIGLFARLDEGGAFMTVTLTDVTITGNTRVGALVGDSHNNTTIVDSYSTGTVSGEEYVGGLLGYHYMGLIEGCSSEADVTGDEYVGGLIGMSQESMIMDSHASGRIEGSYNVGGLVGYLDEGMIIDSYATGEVEGDEEDSGGIGGLVGSVARSTIITSHATGNVRGDSSVGGLAGDSWDSEIIGSFAEGTVSGNYSVGGLVGDNDGYIFMCHATGDVFGDDETGGLVGWNAGGTIMLSYATGDVKGDRDESMQLGGLVGASEEGLITNSYATGSVTGYEEVGGLIGSFDGQIMHCFSTGLVTGSVDVGGLIGNNYDEDSIVMDSFYDMETSGQTASAGGTGKTTAEMKTRATFTDAGWDFNVGDDEGIWDIQADVNNGYPHLAWQTAEEDTDDPEPGPDEVADADGNIYQTTVIGELRWMTENLKTTRYNDGVEIQTTWEGYSDGSYAWYDDDEEYKHLYGGLYNWAAVNTGKLCPDDWRVSSGGDWYDMFTYLVNNYDYINDSNVNHYLKSCRQVNSPLGGDCATTEHPRWNENDSHYGNNEFGFSAFAGGRRNSDGTFANIGHLGQWWTTETQAGLPINAHGYGIFSTSGGLHAFTNSKLLGFSVRCVQDYTETRVDDEPDPVIKTFTLHGNYPNPFNPTTTIRFELPASGPVTIEIYNSMGQRVSVIHQQQMTAGQNDVSVDGSSWASGIYLYAVRYNNVVISNKMTLIK